MALVDDLIVAFDRGLKTLTRGAVAERASPAQGVEDASLSEADRKHAGGLMRVNHTGEICAQALYEGQSITARDPLTRESLQRAAREEQDHLAWCEARLEELDARTSRLNPLFYAASYGLGAAAGLLGDRLSLGFVAATEDQVGAHLDRHLDALPSEDQRSRRVVEQMRADESKHGTNAIAAGGVAFPEPVKNLMSLASRVMTETTYRI